MWLVISKTSIQSASPSTSFNSHRAFPKVPKSFIMPWVYQKALSPHIICSPHFSSCLFPTIYGSMYKILEISTKGRPNTLITQTLICRAMPLVKLTAGEKGKCEFSQEERIIKRQDLFPTLLFKHTDTYMHTHICTHVLTHH